MRQPLPPPDDQVPDGVASGLPVALQSSLQRTADALLACRAQLQQIETAVLAPQSQSAAQGLQSFDLLDQHLADLSLWLSGLATGQPLTQMLQCLRLAELRQSLAEPAFPPPGLPGTTASPPTQTGAELF